MAQLLRGGRGDDGVLRLHRSTLTARHDVSTTAHDAWPGLQHWIFRVLDGHGVLQPFHLDIAATTQSLQPAIAAGMTGRLAERSGEVK